MSHETENLLTAEGLPRPIVATIGVFDGMHRGHRCLIDQVVGEAARRDGRSLVVTFAAHPASVVRPDENLQLLSTPEEKQQELSHWGIDEVVMLQFDSQMARMSARRFMDEVLRQRCGVDVLVIGYDHRFGHNRAEGFDDYVRYGHELGIEVVKATALSDNGIPVSSSAIRAALADGSVSNANAMLGRHYSLEGRVVGGFRVGRRIGYPTANIDVPVGKQLPACGVYAVVATVDGQAVGGMLNIGHRPTFGGENLTVEVNLFDFHANVYDHLVRLEFIDRLRPEQKFDSVEALKRQLAADEIAARDRLAQELQTD